MSINEINDNDGEDEDSIAQHVSWTQKKAKCVKQDNTGIDIRVGKKDLQRPNDTRAIQST